MAYREKRLTGAEYAREFAARHPIRRRAQNLVYGSKHRAKKLGLEFDLTTAWLEERLQAGVCEVTGLPFEFPEVEVGMKGGPKSNWIPSLDRVDPSRGYTQDNIKVVVWCYNGAKASGTHEDVMRLARALMGQQGD